MRCAVADMLTRDEKYAIDLTVELSNLVIQDIIGQGETREGDVREFVAVMHNLQRMIMAQAAARAYPEHYRLLGYTVE